MNHRYGKQIVKAFLSFVILLSSFSAFAQPDNSSIVKVDGEKYYLHIVDAGHTLYAISRMYSVSIEDIVAANPGSDEVIDIGQELLIPVKAVDEEAAENPPVIDGEYLVHTVNEDETLYSLSRRYDVSIEDIVAANPGSETSIQVGQELRIPVDKVQNTDASTLQPAVNLHTSDPTVQTVPPDSIKVGPLPNKRDTANAAVYADVYNVAIMLPFQLDANDYQRSKTPINEEVTIYPATRVALDFYQGALIAIDSLREIGLSVNVYFYDTESDSATVAGLLQKTEMQDMHLFIGPVGAKTLPLVTQYAKEHNRYIICPAPASGKLLLDNPYVCKAVPSNSTQMDQMAAFVAGHYRNENVVVLKSGLEKDMTYFEIFRNNFADYVSGYGDKYRDSAAVGTVGKYDADALEKYLEAGKVNVLVVPSTDLAYVTGFLTKMNALSPRTYDKYQFVIFGMNVWQDWDNMDVHYLQKFNLHLASPNYINYDDREVKNFVRAFRAEYNTDPGKFGFMGYDVTLYHLLGLRDYGTDLSAHLLQNASTVAHTGFDYSQTGEESGYENHYVQFLWYHDYQQNAVTDRIYWDEEGQTWPEPVSYVPEDK